MSLVRLLRHRALVHLLTSHSLVVGNYGSVAPVHDSTEVLAELRALLRLVLAQAPDALASELVSLLNLPFKVVRSVVRHIDPRDKAAVALDYCPGLSNWRSVVVELLIARLLSAMRIVFILRISRG